MIDYILAESKEDYAVAKYLFNDYAMSIGFDLAFQNFENELQKLKAMYAAPQGGIILCKNESDYIGCVAIRKIADKIGELKRMYVKPEFQNFGIGKFLLKQALQLAKDCKYELVRLDTLNSMHSAIHLYKQYGFYEIKPYYYNPNTTAVFFEKDLKTLT